MLKDQSKNIKISKMVGHLQKRSGTAAGLRNGERKYTHEPQLATTKVINRAMYESMPSNFYNEVPKTAVTANRR